MALPLMRRIGRGFYYDVYDLGNGRVRKVPRSQFSQVLTLLAWYALSPKVLLEELKRAPHSESARMEQYEISKKVARVAPHLFGNPRFDGLSYEQDKVVTMGELLRIVPKDEFLRRCREYAAVIHELWKKGIGETVFNFTLNAGINKLGKMVIIDTNEFAFDIAAISPEIASRRFEKASSFVRLPEELKAPVREIFEKEFSSDKLRELWNREGKLTLS